MINFFYGTMGSGKTTELIKTYDIYKRKGLNPVIIKPIIDNREGDFDGWGFTQSRITRESVPCFYYKNILDIYKLDFNSILVDEAQFMDKKDIKYLIAYADHTNTPVLAYGLKTDVNGDLFNGAATWLALADRSIELENICQNDSCNNKAQLHIRFIDGKVDNSSESVVIDKGSVTYKSVCRNCWQKLKNIERS